MAIKGAKNTSMQDKPVAQKEDEQEYFFSEYQVTVRARSIEEANKKLGDLIKKKK